MEKIKTMAELEAICEAFNDQGFGFVGYYDMKDRKLNTIISTANPLRIKYEERQLKELFNGDFEKFEADMQAHFGQFTEDDKLFELANRKSVLYGTPTKRDHSQRTRKVSDKSLTLRAYRDRDTFNKMFELMGYEGDMIPMRSEYNKIPYKMDDNYHRTEVPTGIIKRGSYGKLRTIKRTTYANGHLKLTGDVDEFNELYKKVWEKGTERAETNQCGIKYILID